MFQKEAPLSLIRTGEPIPEGIKPKWIADICLNEARLDRVDYTFDQIRQIVGKESKGVIPESLIEGLNFKALRWQQVYDPSALPLFFIGVGNKTVDRIPLKEATGTIEIDRFWCGKGEVRVVDLRVTGVGQSSDSVARVFASAFEIDSKTLDACGVSVSADEFPFPADSMQERLFKKAVFPIPTKAYMAGSRDTVGVVTEAMVRATEVDGKQHPYLLRARVDYFQGDNELILGDLTEAPHFESSLTDRMSFMLKDDDTSHIIEYRTGEDPYGWAVRFPKVLKG